jgi:hypothetical protein
VKNDRWAMAKSEQDCSHAELRIAMPVATGSNMEDAGDSNYRGCFSFSA